jgi:hypothetical protein
MFHRWIEQNNWIPVGYVNWWIKRKKKPTFLKNVKFIETGLINK